MFFVTSKQRYRQTVQTDRRHAISINTAICTKVHRALKTNRRKFAVWN